VAGIEVKNESEGGDISGVESLVRLGRELALAVKEGKTTEADAKQQIDERAGWYLRTEWGSSAILKGWSSVLG